MSYSYGYTPWYRMRGIWITVSVILAILLGLFGFLVGHYWDVWNVYVRGMLASLRNGFFPSIVPAPATWLIFGIVMVFAAAAAFDQRHRARGTLFSMMAVVALVGGVGIGMWNNDKDGARSYERSTKFIVQDLDDTPRSLDLIVNSANQVEDTELEGTECSGLVGSHSNYSCIEEGTFPSEWDRRVAPATGARTVMSRTSGDVPNTYLMGESMTYLYDSSSEGRWTAIRDGKNRQSTYGVVSWAGTSRQPTVCRFEGDNKINYAFQGRWGRNLNDLIAARYRTLLYDNEDIWGYCDPQQGPVIVIVATQLEAYGNRTTRRAAGIITIRGSASGEPVMEHIENVKSGEFAGPVYPTWLVDQQRDVIQWAAGRANKNRSKFGYEDTAVSSQSGNTENYLLRSNDDGRTYWVTPMSPRSSESEQLVAFSVTPADEVTRGQLNQQRVYVLPDGDDDIVANLDDLLSRVTQAVSTSDPGFFTADPPGRIAEFLPVDQDTWQVFAERNGRVVYRIDVVADAGINPKVYNVTSDDETTGPEGTPTDGEPSSPQPSGVCDPSQLDSLSAKQLAECIGIFADELSSRNADG